MQTERLSYPYVEIEGGIPFDQIVEAFKRDGKFSGIVRGASGSELIVNVDSACIEVIDYKQREKCMYAGLTMDDMAVFSLQTRNYDPDQNGDSLGDVHPDMFGAQFVKFAISFFRENGDDVKACKGMWGSRSLNRQLLERGFAEHGDFVRAAKETWSGRLFISL